MSNCVEKNMFIRNTYQKVTVQTELTTFAEVGESLYAILYL